MQSIERAWVTEFGAKVDRTVGVKESVGYVLRSMGVTYDEIINVVADELFDMDGSVEERMARVREVLFELSMLGVPSASRYQVMGGEKTYVSERVRDVWEWRAVVNVLLELPEAVWEWSCDPALFGTHET